ncbi:hypothetical protein HK105_201551 [Polyrhizophydium stewartii]|uniref:L domain-like protein n=1 Tax=Polyrhizophydium stewartii TaxID=2732419 RepID=A0ABR4NGT6_9FUNG
MSLPTLAEQCAVLAQLGLRGLNATMCCNADLGVTCDPPAPASPTAAAAVVNIDMTSKGLSGPLPRDWSALRMAQSIALPGNAFTGSIPDSFGTLTSLISLDLSNNKLTGMIPASFAQLKSLKFLALANNPGLNGNLPDGFSITRLENCDFSGTPLCQSAIPSKCCTVNGKHPAMLRCGLLSPKTVSSASPTPTASADQPSSGSSNSIVGIVAGAAAGGAILIIAIVGALMFLYDRRKRQQEMEFRGAANNRSLSRATRTPVFDEDPLPPEERPPLPRTGSQSSRRMSFAASGLGTLGRRSSAGGSQVGQTQGSSVKGSVPPPLPPVAFSQDARSPGASQSARSADPLMSAGYSGSVVSQGSPFAKSPMTEPSLVGSQHSAQSFFFPPSQTGAAQRAGISGSQALSSIYSATSLEDSADYAYPAQPQSSYRGGSR